MCMLSYIPANVEIEENDLLNGGIINGDGSGWAIAARDHILMGKSMKVEEALDEFVEIRKEYPDCDALFHSRWATHGTTSVANVHPFLVNNSHKTVVGHNGVLPCTPKKGDWRSDTRVLADEHLGTRFRRFDKPTVMNALSDYIGRNNKLVILTVDERYKKNAYIVNENMGHWDSVTKVWHSNYDYLGVTKKYSGGYGYTGTSSTWSYGDNTYTKVGDTWVPSTSAIAKQSKQYNYGDENCDYCGYGVVGKAGYCLECGTCDDCGDFRQDCQCWSGYYKNFDWDQRATARKALDASPCPTENGIPTLGYRKSADMDRAGMSCSDIVDQIDALESE